MSKILNKLEVDETGKVKSVHVQHQDIEKIHRE